MSDDGSKELIDLRNSVRAAWIYLDELKRWADWDRLDELSPHDIDLAMDDVIGFCQRIKALAYREEPSADTPIPYPIYRPGVIDELKREAASRIWGVGALDTPSSLVAKNERHGEPTSA